MRKNKTDILISFSSSESTHSDDSFNSSVDSGKYIWDDKDQFFNQADNLKKKINIMEKENPYIKNKIVYKQYDFSKDNPF
jgi:hypothetical protein